MRAASSSGVSSAWSGASTHAPRPHSARTVPALSCIAAKCSGVRPGGQGPYLTNNARLHLIFSAQLNSCSNTRCNPLSHQLSTEAAVV